MKGKRVAALLMVLVLAAVLASATLAVGQPVATSSAPEQGSRSIETTREIHGEYAPGQVIVKFKSGMSESGKRRAAMTVSSGEVLNTIGPAGGEKAEVIRLKPGVTVKQAVAQLSLRSDVLYAEPDYVVRGAYTPNDPYFDQQWGLNNHGQTVGGVAGKSDADIDAPQAWDTEQGYSHPTVAVLDSGVDVSHPDLKWKIRDDGYNFAGISQLAGERTYPLGSGLYPGYAQCVEGTGQTLTHAGFFIAKVGNPTQPIQVSLANEGTYGPSNTALSYFKISPSEVSSAYNLIYKQFNKTVTLTDNVRCFLVLWTNQSDANNYYAIATHDNFDKNQNYYPIYVDRRECNSWAYNPYAPPYYWSNFFDCFAFITNANRYAHDDHGHGTHCSGTVAAVTNNSTGVAGTCPGAVILPVKVLGANCTGYVSWACQGIYYAADKGASIISMSICNAQSTAEQDACTYAYNKGCTIFAPSGDSGNSVIQYPAGCQHVIGVGATDNQDRRASFSTYNNSVDLTAPGWNILSTLPTYAVNMSWRGYSLNYDYMSGTSMACAMAAGVGALVKSHEPSMSPSMIERRLKIAADDLGSQGRDNYYGYGRINAAKPYISLLSPTSTTTGYYIIIYGSNFGGSRGSSYVKFGSTVVSSAGYNYWYDTKIRVKVPSTISRGTSVTVHRSGVGTSNAKTFKVKPKINSLSPTSGKRGSKVTITGTAFGPKSKSSYVKFGTLKAYIYSWGNTKIVVKVPSASYGSCYVRVTTSGGTSTGKGFTVKR